MAFDDLAKHMASRAGKKISAGSADQIVAEAKIAALRMSRTRDLILGLLLLVGGLVILAGTGLTLFNFLGQTPNALQPGGGTERIPRRVWVIFLFAGSAAVIVGTKKLIRGLAGRSN